MINKLKNICIFVRYYNIYIYILKIYLLFIHIYIYI